MRDTESFDSRCGVDMLSFVIGKYGGVIGRSELREVAEAYGNHEKLINDFLKRGVLVERRLNRNVSDPTYVVAPAGLALHAYNMLDPEKVALQ